jgi:hypothetical protein
MTSEDFTGWRKASYSDANANCVQVATGDRVVAVCDTKEQGQGPVLKFPAAAWRSFIASGKSRVFR